MSAERVPAAPAPVAKLVVLGVGLIGGSFALALRAAGRVGQVVGVGRGEANLATAVELGIVDRYRLLADDWPDELATADLVVIAAPVAQYPSLFAAMAGRLGTATLVTDAGSTKQDVIAAARVLPAAEFARFVPAHPIAGTEHSGAVAAFATLFTDRNVVLAPVADTDPAAVARVGALWECCGARLRSLSPAAHDRVFAAVSHLPHLLAFALVDAFAARPDRDDIFRFAASGFRDFTRIAASSPEMWRDIALANRPALLDEIAAFRAQLDRVTAMLEAADGAALAAVFERARTARRAWGAAQSLSAAVPADGPRDPPREGER